MLACLFLLESTFATQYYDKDSLHPPSQNGFGAHTIHSLDDSRVGSVDQTPEQLIFSEVLTPDVGARDCRPLC